MTTASFIYRTCDGRPAASRLSTMDAIHTPCLVYQAYGMSLLTVTRTSHIPSVTVESHEAVDKLSANIQGGPQKRVPVLLSVTSPNANRFS